MLILLEGLDKTGKTTVAEGLRRVFKCDYMHMSAPAKHHNRKSYIAEMLHTLALTANKNVVVDRTWYGELVWPQVYNRQPLLTKEDVNIITAAAVALHGPDEVKMIYMHDPNQQAHQERLRKFKEPSYKYDETYSLYNVMAIDEGFQFLTFQEAKAKGWT